MENNINKVLRRITGIFLLVIIVIGFSIICNYDNNRTNDTFIKPESNENQYLEIGQTQHFVQDNKNDNLVIAHKFVNTVDDKSNQIIRKNGKYFRMNELKEIHKDTYVISNDELIFVSIN